MDERRKAGLINMDLRSELDICKQDIIETDQNTIIISDFSGNFKSSKSKQQDKNDSEDDDKMKKSEIEDTVINKTKAQLSKECSIINERLEKLEKQKKSLELSKTKKFKNGKKNAIKKK